MKPRIEKIVITEETSLSEIIKYEKAIKILLKYQFPCINCPMARIEMQNLKIGKISELYGIDKKGLIEELNSVLSAKNEKV